MLVIGTRQDAVTRGTLSNDDFDGEMDDASYHLESIEEKSGCWPSTGRLPQ